MKDVRSGTYLFLGILIVAGVFTAFIFLPELDAIVLGICLAVLFRGWYKAFNAALQNRGGGGIAAACIVLIAVILIFVPIIFFGFEIFSEAQGLYIKLAANGAGDTFTEILRRVAPGTNINLGAYAEQGLGFFVNALGPIVSGFLSVIATFILSFFALYYFLRDGAKLWHMIATRSPFTHEETQEVLGHLERIVTSIVQGSLLVAAAYGIATGVGFFIFGIPTAILWGGVTAIASFIPGIGVFLVVIPGIAYLAFIGNIFGAVGLTLWLIVMSAAVETAVRPMLMGRRADIHPMLLLFAVLGGLSFFGPIGLLLGPLVLGVFLALLQAYPSLGWKSLSEK